MRLLIDHSDDPLIGVYPVTDAGAGGKFSVRGPGGWLLGARGAGRELTLNTRDGFFGEFSREEVIGLWLRYALRPEADLLSPFISTEGLSFSPEEYFELVDAIKEAKRRLARPGPPGGILAEINTGFYRHRAPEDSVSYIRDRITAFAERARELVGRFYRAQNGIARQRLTRAREKQREREIKLAAVRAALTEILNDGKKLSGRTRRRLAAAYTEYATAYPDAAPHPPDHPLSETLAKEEAAVAALPDRRHRKLQADLLALSTLTVAPEYAGTLSTLADELFALLAEVDESGIYQLPVATGDAMTTPRQLRQAEQLLSRFEETLARLGDFPDYHARQRYWYGLPAALRRLLPHLIPLPEADWNVAFRAWYLERCAERRARPIEPSTLVSTHVPLSDTSAVHVPVFGFRRPALSFLQFFVPLHPPEWRLQASPGVKLSYRFDADRSVLSLPSPEELGDELIDDWEAIVLNDTDLTIEYDWSSDQITAGLLSDGLNSSFLAAALIRTAEGAAEVPFDRQALLEMAREVRRRFAVPEPRPHPSGDALGELLSPRLPDYFFQPQYAWRDTILPLLITSPRGRKMVVLADDRLPGGGEHATDERRKSELTTAGFTVLNIDSESLFSNTDLALAALEEQIKVH